MYTHTICTIAQLHGFIAHSQFWHAFSIFLLCNVLLRSNVFPKLHENIIYVFLTDMLQLRGIITLSPRLSMLHGIIIDELQPDQLSRRQPGECYHVSDIEVREKVDRT